MRIGILTALACLVAFSVWQTLLIAGEQVALVSEDAKSPPSRAQAGRCDDRAPGGLIGRPDTPELRLLALRLAGAAEVAPMGQGQPPTAGDHRADRLNIVIERGVIVGFICG